MPLRDSSEEVREELGYIRGFAKKKKKKIHPGSQNIETLLLIE